MSRFAPEDLEPAERQTQELLAGVPPQVLPIGFRDAVMRQVAATRPKTWEWIIAAALAIPSLAFLVHEHATHGDEFATALNNVMAAAAAETARQHLIHTVALRRIAHRSCARWRTVFRLVLA